MDIIFASHNQNKAREIQAALPGNIRIVTLYDLGFNEEIPETADTLEGNAILKAQFVYKKWGKPCFSDDSGLEIRALGGEPGVYSARYAGPQRSDQDNMDLVLSRLEGIADRAASFKTVIALITGGKIHLFEGRVNGVIRNDKKGTNGFGYDPIFEPEGMSQTFAEMTLEAKSSLSHRKRAVAAMADFLALLPGDTENDRLIANIRGHAAGEGEQDQQPELK